MSYFSRDPEQAVKLVDYLAALEAVEAVGHTMVLRPTKWDTAPGYFRTDAHGANAGRMGHGRDPADYVPCTACGRRHDPRSEVCFFCSQSAKRLIWDEAKIVAKAQEWAERYGRPPARTDWAPARTNTMMRHHRFHDPYHGYWPSTAAVQRHVGGFRRLREIAFPEET